MIDMPFWIASLYTGTWNFARVRCRVTGLVMSIVAYASLFTLALIDFNRYIKVLKRSLYRKVFPQKKISSAVSCSRLDGCHLFFYTLTGWVGKDVISSEIWLFETDLYTLLFAGVLVNGIMIIIFYRDKFCRRYTFENLSASAKICQVATNHPYL